MKIIGAFLLTISLVSISWHGARAQEETEAVVKATEFSMPKSGAFTLLGNNPANVTTPGFTKDIKLDYFLDKFSLKPNIAFEFQPVWLLGFKNVSLDEYSKKSTVSRFLSTANMSVGTHTVDDGLSKIAYSIKLTIAKDPLLDQAYRNSIQFILDKSVRGRTPDAAISQKRQLLRNQNRKTESELTAIDVKLLIFQSQLIQPADATIRSQVEDSIMNYSQRKSALNSRLDSIQNEINALNTKLEEGDSNPVYTEQLKLEVKRTMENYIECNWYKPKLDFGAGLVNTYQNASITQPELKKSGFGIWLNPSFGFVASSKKDISHSTNSIVNNAAEKLPAKVILTGLFRYVDSKGASQSFIGGNIRYGSRKINLFTEYTFLREGSIETNTIAYGGSYSIGTKKVIEFGIRTDYTDSFSFKSLLPVIAFDWKLASEIIK